MGGLALETHIGEKYGCLTITGIDRERMRNSGGTISYVFADCDCGVKGKSYSLAKMKCGETRSCGHLRNQHGRQFKFNNIEYCNDDYGILYTDDGTPFLFDLDDLDIVRNRFWYKDSSGYLTHAFTVNYKTYCERLHRLVLCAGDDEYVDHINRDITDNRKQNLRICTHKDNDRNRNLRSTNCSGIIGVTWDKTRNKWKAAITVNYITIHLGRFESKEDAIEARLNAEKEYFGNYAPQQYLFEQYGVM